VVDERGRAQLANRAFRALLGLPADAGVRELLDLAREPRLNDLIAEAVRSGEPRSAEVDRTDPVTCTLSLFANPLALGGGAVVVARDITETEQLHRMRKDFVANVSHELKTPLSAIRGYAETLVDGAVDERATALRFSERILEQCRRLGELLDDLLTLSRLESAASIREPERVDLRELAAEAAALAAPRAAAKPVSVELAPGASPVIDGDWEGLLRLLTNLLDNAIKYNHPGGSVRIELGEQAGLATIAVADSGIGIPPAQLGRIFERFYRVDKGRAREEGGTGLGLAIVKHVAQAHKGRIEVESVLGAGTTFRVLIPLPD
jgi:two-component system phosphate regulon sensor histidine kinase PhoR